MLKRLRSAHPMLYCLVAEVLFLGMLRANEEQARN